MRIKKQRSIAPVAVVEPPLGAKPRLAWIRVDALAVDPSYQRSLDPESSRTLVREIARRWDWRLCQPLAVAQRPDGTLFVVDGQHRLEGAIARGEAQTRAGIPHDVVELPCVVAPVATAAEEAATFTGLNRKRRSLTAVEIHRAQLVAGETGAAEIASLIADAGLVLAPHSNYTAWKPGMIFCLPGVASANKRFGRVVVSSALVALSEAFEGKVLRYAGQLLQALVVVYATEGAKQGFDPDAFIERLGANTQEQWMRKAAERIAETGEGARNALVGAIVDAYRRSTTALAA